MKIDLGHGAYLEPDPEPRDSKWHMRIVATRRIPNTRVGHVAVLECGHVVQTFGRPKHSNGVVLCTACRDAAEAHGPR